MCKWIFLMKKSSPPHSCTNIDTCLSGWTSISSTSVRNRFWRPSFSTASLHSPPDPGPCRRSASYWWKIRGSRLQVTGKAQKAPTQTSRSALNAATDPRTFALLLWPWPHRGSFKHLRWSREIRTTWGADKRGFYCNRLQRDLRGRGTQSRGWTWTLPFGGRGWGCNGWSLLPGRSSSCFDSGSVPVKSPPQGLCLHLQSAAGSSLQGQSEGNMTGGKKLLSCWWFMMTKKPRQTVAEGERLKNSNCCLIIAKKQHAANVPEENKHITQCLSLRLKPNSSHSIPLLL